MTPADAQSVNDPSDETSNSTDSANHVLQLIDRNQQLNNQRREGSAGIDIRTVGVVGAGYMGSAVAAGAVQHGLPVTIIDSNEQTLSRATESIQLSMQEANRSINSALVTSAAELVRQTSDLADVAKCDLVVEAVVENPLIKREIFGKLEKHRSANTIIVSNTSTLSVAQLATELKDPARFCGLHYFPPVSERPMLEIIPGSDTSDETTSAVVGFAESLGRIPLVVADGRGFIVNRMLMAYMNAPMRLISVGIDPMRIEESATNFGMRMGPLRIYDEIGLDVAFNAAWSISADSDALVTRSPVLIRLVKTKQLGRKTGRGIFMHEEQQSDGAVGQINPQVTDLIARHVETRKDLSDEELTFAIVLPMVVEATRLIQEGRARDAGQVDLAAMFGFGFPTSRGGLFYWADQVGAGRIAEMLQSLSHLGPHLEPTELLLQTARRNGRFYELTPDAASS